MTSPVRPLAASRTTLTLAAIVLLFLALASTGVAFGSTWIPLAQVWDVLLGAEVRGKTVIILQFRLPRVVIAALAGGGFAVAGYLLQRVTRNELASPGILGVVDGAALAVVCFLAALSNESNALVTSVAYQPVAAVAGSIAAIFVVFAFAGRQAASAIRLLLFGTAVAAVLKSLTVIAMLVRPVYQAGQAARWIAGAVNEINWNEIRITAIGMLPLTLVVLIVVRRLPPADLDEMSARSVGLNLPSFRIQIFVLAAAISALSAAFVGGVGFIGLMAPHLARRLIGRGVHFGLIGSFFIGASMLVGADIIVRLLFSPTEVPAGTVPAVIGAPYFLYLLMRNQRHG
ncbi:iron ABC transporter permease [Rhizobium sophoriradicis]|uniref:FecCD family ABC transporter permease n=1 Tax=Rhizobium TaxID=379 RepID=UPI00098F4DD2|nr:MULTISPECIES: iron ABC transporter permease [Rhizobium]ARQ61836.1 iron-siderophore transporter permease protein [Rhizobium sp. Kim5]RSC02005.1 iron ABC transporter permease [Rhizobium sophoriradicis]